MKIFGNSLSLGSKIRTMKKNYSKIAAGLALISSAAIAQPTFTSSNVTTVGESQSFYVCDSFATDYANVTGANVTWDYSAIFGYNGTTAQNDIVAASTTPQAADFPGATEADEMEGNLLIFRANNNDSIYSQGYFFTEPNLGDVSVQLTDDPMRLMSFPFTYNDSYTDFHQGEAVTAGFGNLPFDGNTSVTADGYGTLLVGTTTYTNVLRVKIVENSVADAGFLGSIPVVRTQYYYYDFATSNFPVFLHVTIDLQGTAQTAVYSQAQPGANSIEESTIESVSLYPNPTNGNVQINFSSLSNEKVSVEILDILGKKVETLSNKDANKGLNQLNADLSAYETGIYFVRITQGNSVATKKLIKR